MASESHLSSVMPGKPTRFGMGLAVWLLLSTGCGPVRDVERSWELARWAAERVQRGEAAKLCASFSEQMLGVVSCDALEKLLREVAEAMGEPGEACRWAYTYRIAAVDPLVATTIRSCPFAQGDLMVTVIAEITGERERIVGLWLDAPAIRGLTLEP